jgi:hypothetical protein
MSRFSLVAAVLATALPALASAATVDATLNGVGLNQVVSVKYNGNDHLVYAGALNWSSQNSPFGSTFSTFCIEFVQDVDFNQTYSYTTLSDIGLAPYPYVAPTGNGATGMESVLGLGTTRNKETLLRQLWGEFYASTKDGLAAGSYNDSIETAAFQVAIWKILYECSQNAVDQTSLNSGIFKLNNGGLVGSKATEYLDWLIAHPTADLANGLTALSNPTAQDQILFTGLPSPISSPVPLPTTAAMGASVLGVMTLKRARRQ